MKITYTVSKQAGIGEGPVTSWQIDGETMETVRDYFGGSKITADGDYSHEIKRCLLLGRKAVINLAYSEAETLLC